jgi:hypothetical protein
MLLTIAGIVVAIWIIGLIAHIAGGFINFLLVVAIVMVIAHIMGRRSHTI